MGHNTITDTVSIEHARTADDALEIAVRRWQDEEAGRYEDARDGSSPTFPLMTPAVAAHFIGSAPALVYDGCSAAVPICAESDVVTSTKTISMTVTAEELAALRKRQHLLRERVAALAGSGFLSYELVTVPKPRKARAEATTGKSVTRYMLIADGGSVVGDFASQADARIGALAYVNANAQTASVAVRGYITREGGTRDLVVVARPEPDSSTVKVRVTTSVPKPGAKQAAWFVGFDYHS